MKIGINGFGRIGRLVFRALWDRPGIVARLNTRSVRYEPAHVLQGACHAHH
jgi:glyceraldehyde-3-phosphate dehydrogenase/erythrose-4-phosphate dehydrogenase